jgi:tRNA A-37 threonylcarbamoyl transferase component Bud32
MSIKDLDKVAQWVEKIISEKITESYIAMDSLNSKVFIHKSKSSRYVTKKYDIFNNGRLRFNRERYFIDFCKDFVPDQIPKILAYDDSNLIICQNYIDGNKLSSSQNLIKEIISFVFKINQKTTQSEFNIVSADCMFSLQELFTEIERRLLEIQLLKLGSDIEYIPNLERLFLKYKHELIESDFNEIFLNRNLKKILSPSDIGPHNMIFNQDKCNFIDFEFAGIDSNIKLGCDIITHPDINFFRYQNDEIDNMFFDTLNFFPGDIPSSLLNLFHLKWIFLSMKRASKQGRYLNEREKNFIEKLYK